VPRLSSERGAWCLLMLMLMLMLMLDKMLLVVTTSE
jgi:hypothetical protein